jgi:hypothetical protein
MARQTLKLFHTDQEGEYVITALACNILVSFESLYGMWPDFPSTRALMTFPSADKDRLIFVASLRRSPGKRMATWERRGDVGEAR